MPCLAVCLLVACSESGSKDPSSADGGSAGFAAMSGAAGSGDHAGSGGASGASAGSGTVEGNAGTAPSGGAGAGAAGGASGAGGTAGNLAGAGGSAGTAGGTPREETLLDLTTVRQEHAVVALAGEIYVIGGYTPNATATVDAYDPVAQSWRDVRDFPMALNHANAAAVGDKLYVTGFYVGSSMSNTSRQVFAYDPAMNEWTERTPMADGTQRATGCVAALGDTIYVFGGARGSTVTDASAYDTVLDEWQSLPALPESREHCAAGAIDGILYIAAGRSGGISGFRPATLAFDPTAMSYSMKAPIPTARGGVAGAVLNDRLLVFGGEGNTAVSSGVFPNVEAYDPRADAWEALPPLTIPRHGYGAATLDGRIYLAGGATTQGFGAVNDFSAYYLE
ncbi:MAG TPA: kelch repeat-containing protein [Polyangiaceae bacterium]|nr:kelch repeat-containing protein [Polyangiaceae bacterium]